VVQMKAGSKTTSTWRITRYGYISLGTTRIRITHPSTTPVSTRSQVSTQLIGIRSQLAADSLPFSHGPGQANGTINLLMKQAKSLVRTHFSSSSSGACTAAAPSLSFRRFRLLYLGFLSRLPPAFPAPASASEHTLPHRTISASSRHSSAEGPPRVLPKSEWERVLCVLNAGRTGNELHSTPFTGMHVHEAPVQSAME
jgi:hypothetical protein